MFTDEEIRQGRRRLKRLLPGARAEARRLLREDGGLRPGNPVSQSLLEEIEERNLDALVIRSRGAGRWHADLLFRRLPPGLPTVIGTPEADPLGSEAEAASHGALILAAVVKAIEERRMAGDDRGRREIRFFELHGVSFEFPVPLIEALAAALAAAPEEIAEVTAEFRTRLDRRLDRVMGGPGFDGDRWNAAEEEDRIRALADMATLLAVGVFRHPERRDVSSRN
jgi:hypothetical protein